MWYFLPLWTFLTSGLLHTLLCHLSAPDFYFHSQLPSNIYLIITNFVFFSFATLFSSFHLHMLIHIPKSNYARSTRSKKLCLHYTFFFIKSKKFSRASFCPMIFSNFSKFLPHTHALLELK